MSKKKRYTPTSCMPTFPDRVSAFGSSSYRNDITFIALFKRMKDICLNLFRYEDKPDTVSVRYMEEQLFSNGFAIWFADDVTKNQYCLGGILDGRRNFYGDYISYRAVSFDGGYVNRDLNETNSVLFYNNYVRIPTAFFVEDFAYRLYKIYRTIETNLDQQKTSKVFRTSNQQRLSIENFLMKVEGFQVYQIVDKDFQLDDNPVVDLTVPFIADKMEVEKESVWNDFFTFLGVENYNSTKREREFSTESMARLGSVEIQRNSMLRTRQEAIDKINRIFGNNIKLSFNSDLPSVLNGYLKDGESYVNLHNIGTEYSRESDMGQQGQNDL